MAGLLTIVTVVGLLITVTMCIPVFWQMRNHPRGLHILFFTEMWERFSYYGMRALLIYYLTQHFLFDDEFAGGQYGAYTSLVYLLPLVGGYLADRYLGNRKAIAFGALLLVAGHATMAVHGEPADQVFVYGQERIVFEAEGRGDSRRVFLPVGEGRCELNPAEDAGECAIRPNPDGDFVFSNLPAGAALPSVIPASDYTLEVENRSQLILNVFFLALALIIMGVGFLKASISSIVGQLYEQGDPRRDPGFTLYYFGINLGAFWASILCGALGETYGWHYGFGLAGIGMALGWIVFRQRRLLFFIPGPPQLPDHVGAPPEPEKLGQRVAGPLSREWLIYLGGFLGVAVVWMLVQSPPIAIVEALGGGSHAHIGALLSAGTIGVGLYIFVFMLRECTAIEAQRLILAIILILASVVFWSFFEQAGSSLSLFAARNTDLPNDGFFTVTASQTQAFNAGWILIFAPILSALWAWLGRRNLDPNPALKFGLGLVQLGFGFFVLVWGAQFADENFRVPLVFLGLLYLFHTTGELFLSPVGLSMITKLSPLKVLSTMMAVWFLSSAWAQFVGGIIAGLAGVPTVAGDVLDPQQSLDVSTQVFSTLGYVAIGVGAALAAFSFLLKRMAHESLDRDGSPLPTAHVQPDPPMPHPSRPTEGDV